MIHEFAIIILTLLQRYMSSTRTRGASPLVEVLYRDGRSTAFPAMRGTRLAELCLRNIILFGDVGHICAQSMHDVRCSASVIPVDADAAEDYP